MPRPRLSRDFLDIFDYERLLQKNPETLPQRVRTVTIANCLVAGDDEVVIDLNSAHEASCEATGQFVATPQSLGELRDKAL